MWKEIQSRSWKSLFSSYLSTDNSFGAYSALALNKSLLFLIIIFILEYLRINIVECSSKAYTVCTFVWIIDPKCVHYQVQFPCQILQYFCWQFLVDLASVRVSRCRYGCFISILAFYRISSG